MNEKFNITSFQEQISVNMNPAFAMMLLKIIRKDGDDTINIKVLQAFEHQLRKHIGTNYGSQ